MRRLRRWIKRKPTSGDQSLDQGMEKKEHFTPDILVNDDLQRSIAIKLDWAESCKRDVNRTGFLDLPRELRDKIYAYCLLLEQPFDVGNYDANAGSKRPTKFPLWNRYSKACKLLCTCQQVHAEAAPVLYGGNHFETSAPSSSVAMDGLLTLDDESQLPINSQGVPDRLTIMPFHPAYRSLVAHRSFRSGARWPNKNGGLQFLLAMMSHLRHADGAYFRAQALRWQTPWTIRNDVYVAGWRPKGVERPLLAHNKYDCDSSATLEYVASSDDTVMAISRLSGAAEVYCDALQTPDAIKHLNYKIRVHCCLIAKADSIAQPDASLDDILAREDILKMVYVFTPTNSPISQTGTSSSH